MSDVPAVEVGAAADRDLEATLRAAQRLLFKYPIAARALFSAFAAEGRRFATTPEGAAWRDDLSRSELVRRARTLWDVGTLHMLQEGPTGLPTAFAEAIVRALGQNDLEGLLHRVAARGRRRDERTS